MTAYQYLNLSLSPNDQITSLSKRGNEILVTSARSLYKLNDNSLELKGTFPIRYGISAYVSNTSYQHLISVGTLFSASVDSYQTTSIVKAANTLDHLVFDGNSCACIAGGAKITYYTPGLPVVQFSLPQFSYWSSSFYRGAVLKSNTLYWAERDGAANQYKKDKIKTPKSTIWAINLTTKQVTDITEGLPCLNKLGNPYGPIGSLVANQDKTTLYVSTEEGVFERSTNGTGWTKILSNWGNLTLLPLEGNDLLAWAKSGDNKVIYLYKEGKWLTIPDIPDKGNITHAVAEGNKVYIRFNKNSKGLGVIDLTQAKPIDPEISLTTYLNLSGITAATYTDNQLLVANSAIWSVSNQGNTTKIVDINQTVNEMVSFNGKLLIATQAGLYSYANGSLTTVINSGSQNSRIACSPTMAAYLNNKTVTILNNQLNTVTSLNLDNSYITDIAVRDSQLFVCGFDNRKRNGVPVQIAYLFYYTLNSSALTYTGNTWYYNAATLGNDMADTRLYYMEVAGDKLALLGECAGGNTIFRWNGKNLFTKTTKGFDIYNEMFNSKSAHVSYYCLVDIATKTVLSGQFAVTRRPTGMLSNTSRARTLYLDVDNIYVGMQSAFSIPRRDKFADQPVAAYTGGDASMLSVNQQMTKRNFWCTPGTGNPILFNDKVAVISTTATDLYCTEAVTANTELTNNTYLVVF